MWCEKNPSFRDWDYEKKCNAWIEYSKQERALYFFRELEMHFQFLVCVVVHSALNEEKITQLTKLGYGMSSCRALISERLTSSFLAWKPHTRKVPNFLHFFKDLRDSILLCSEMQFPPFLFCQFSFSRLKSWCLQPFKLCQDKDVLKLAKEKTLH